MTSMSTKFNPRIKFVSHIYSLSSQKYKDIITNTIDELYSESQNAAILMNKLR